MCLIIKTQFKASTGLVTLILLSCILVVLFVSKDNLIHTEKITQYTYHQYLVKKFNLIETLQKDKNILCRYPPKNNPTSDQNFTFFCKKTTIFKTELTAKKYVFFNDIRNFLDIDSYQSSIIHIRSLADLPKTSRSKPIIVIADTPIDERLKHNFYGIIITNHYFDITGKKFYGKLYSSHDNQREERNLSYNKTVIKKLKKKYAIWSYLPHSQNMLNEEK